MATPNADRLHGIESWDTTSIEQANSHLREVKGKLEEVAGINERVAADLGLEGTTAESVQADLGSVARDLKDHSEGIGKLIEVSEEAMKGGIQAKERSAEIQEKLGQVNQMNDGFNSMAKALPGGGSVSSQLQAKAQEQLEAAHAEFEKRAKKVLHELYSRTESAISGLPFIQKQTKSYGPAEPGINDRRGPTPGIGGSDDGDGRGRRGAPGDGSSGGYQQTGPSRSATAWHTPGNNTSVGSAGSYAGSTGHSSVSPIVPGQRADSWSLQSSHYTPSSSGSVISGGGAHPSVLHSPAVHNPLASAAAIGGGGAAVAGYKAYQAARAARTAQSTPTPRASSMRSGATMRTPTTPSTSIVKGATTAARATTSSTSLGKAGSVRGGATGIARPVSASPARGSSILKGTTTAARAAAPTSSGRGSGILKGATTAARATSSAKTQGTAGSARSGATSARGAGSGAARGTGVSGRAMAGRSAGGSSSAKGANGVRGGAGASAGRSSSVAGRASAMGRTTSSTTASSRSAAARPGMTRPGTSAEGRSASTSRAISGLTGGRGKGRKDKRREDHRPIEETQVSLYETDNTVTFLEAGRREEPQENQDQRDKHQG